MKVPAQTLDLKLGTMKVSNLIGTDVKLDIQDEDVKVTGTLHKVDSWPEFSTTDNTGHFFPFKLPAVCKGQKVTTGGRTAGDRTVTIDEGLLLVVRIENLTEAKILTLTMNGETFMKADFTKATMEGEDP